MNAIYTVNRLEIDPIGLDMPTYTSLNEKFAQELPKPHRLSFYAIVLTHQGRANCVLDFEHFTLTQGKILLVKPYQVFQFQPEPNWDGEILRILPEFFQPKPASHEAALFSQYQRFSHCYPIEPQQFQLISHSLSLIKSALASPFAEQDKAPLLRYQLYALLAWLVEFWRDSLPTETPQRQRYFQFSDLIEQHFQQAHQLRFYADKLACTERSLTRACREVTGKAAKTVLIERIILEGKRLLAHSTLPINQIAHQLGFSEPTNFVRFFKQATGKTPKKFRER